MAGKHCRSLYGLHALEGCLQGCLQHSTVLAALCGDVVRARSGSMGHQLSASQHRDLPYICRKRKLGQHASSLVSSMGEALQSCRATCQEAQAASTLSAEHAVHLCADLDLAYYSLLEHHLSCGHPVPPVPPPHSYFPALAQAHSGAHHDTCGCYRRSHGG